MEIYTDSKNCTYEKKKITSRIHRWKLLLNEFNYEICHIRGEQNTVADELSRCFSISNNPKEKILENWKTCTICNRVKISNLRHNRNNQIFAKERFERISMDISGPFKANEFKTKNLEVAGYILSITDIYTRFTRLYFLGRIHALKIIDKLKEWIKEFATPKYIISDNGKQFRNQR